MSELLNELMATKPKKSTEILSVRIPLETHRSLEHIAEITGRTKAALVKAIIDAGLKEIEAQL